MICFSTIIASYSAILCLLVPYHLLSVRQEVDALASRGGRRKNKTGTNNKKYQYLDTNNNKSTTHHHHHAILHDLVAEQQQRQQQQQQFQHNDDETISSLSSSISSHSSSVSSSAIWIDMENVRGKSGFLLNHQDVLEKTELWMQHFQLQDQIIIVVDHGGERDISKPSAYYMEQKQYAVVFSGNACKADDIIARGIGDETCFPFYSSSSTEEEERNNNTVATTKTTRERGSLGLQQRLTTGGIGKTIVVTADNELIARCRRAAKNEFHLINPQVFLDDLEWVSSRQQQIEQQQIKSQEQQRRQQQSTDDKNTEHQEQREVDTNKDDELSSTTTTTALSSSSSLSSSEEESTTPLSSSLPLSLDEKRILNELDIEIRLRGQLLDTEIQLNDRKKKRTNNKRKKLNLRIQGLRTKLATLRKGPSLLDQLISNNEDVDGIRIPRAQQNVLLARWKEIQQSPSSVRLHHRKEQTEDRIIYAESLRRELEHNPNAINTKLETKVKCDVGDENNDDTIARTFLPSAKLFVNHINGYNNNDSTNDRVHGGSNDMTTKRLFYSTTFPVSTSVPVPASVLAITTMEGGDNTNAVNDDTIIIPSTRSTEQLLLLEKNIREKDVSKRSNEDEGQHDEKQTTTITTSTLDIVVISDTHGFENQLGPTLPKGDVLLHLGDFAYEGSHQAELRSLHHFDLYLSKQTHLKYKIVIRGNHDPMYYDFPLSKALYVTSPTNLNVCGFQLTCIPYGNARKLSESGVLKTTTTKCCDILASHCPPYHILDKTYTGKHVGSSYLTNAIRTSYKNNKSAAPPKVWLVGHIHEGRGSVKQNIVGGSSDNNNNKQDTTTTVINAANANLGYATHLEHGPVVVRIDQNHRDVEILQMDDNNNKNGNPKSSVSNTSGNPSFFDDDHGQQQQQQQQPPTTTTTTTTTNNSNMNSNSNRLLLSVDLGLKSGMSLFSNHGHLVRYEQFHFQDRRQLQNDIVTIMRDWEKEVNVKGNVEEDEDEVVTDKDDDARLKSKVIQSQEQEHRDTEDDDDDDLEVTLSVPWKITHIAIEGGDTELLDIWSNAAPNHSSLLRVSPEEWRSELLTRKETTSGRTAKEASRLIARQIVAKYGSDQASEPHVGKFHTDVAEAVCLGMYVSRRLGWIASKENEPAIQRYTNGNIIVPTLTKKIKK